MDGTIVDTEPYWMRAEEELVASYNGTWTTEAALSVVGSDLWDAARVFQAHGVDLPADEIVDRLTTQVLDQVTETVPWRPGARELLRELKEAGIPCALVTMSLRRMADRFVDAIGFEAFDVVIGGDDIENGKPHPDPYLRGAELLGVSAADCIAIEDSRTGLASALASGAVTLGVPAHLPIPESEGYTLWPTLADRTVADLSDLFQTVRQGSTS